MRLLIDPYIMASAVLYALAFIVPVWCHWCVFIFLIPLFWYVSMHMKTPLRIYALQGFWWGTIFFTLHMQAVLYMLVRHAPCVMHGMLAGILLIGYCAFICAIWFVTAAFLARLITQTHEIYALYIWAFVTSLYIFFVDTLLFKAVYLPRGYVFAHPLVPLAEYEAWIAALLFLPQWVFIVCLTGSSVCITYLLLHKRCQPCIVLLLIIFVCPYMWGWFAQQEEDCPYDMFVYAQPPSYNKDMTDVTPLILAQQINARLREVLKKFPHAAAVFFPESTFPFPLNVYEEAWQLWAENTLFGPFDQVLILMGAHYAMREKRSNTLYCFTGRRIIQTYDKSTPLPFAEYLPWPWNKSRFFSELLLKNKKTFQRIHDGSAPILLASHFMACPYICSDLFFNYPRCDDRADVIVWIVNDSWFCSYYQHLMLLFAKLQANVYKKTLLYIAHERGICIQPFKKHAYLPAVYDSPKAIK